jgi:hypothetical protein
MESVRKQSSNSADDFWVSPKYKASQWKQLQLDSDDEIAWSKAADIVEDRIRGRFAQWIDLIAPERFSGFAVIALDCLLIETLVGFITGQGSEGPDRLLTGELAKGEFQFTRDEARRFRKNVRNGIIHDAETRCRWIIRPGAPGGQILTKSGKNILLNRTAFHSALMSEFENWLGRVRKGDRTLRKNMRKRMKQIIQRHSEAVQ